MNESDFYDSEMGKLNVVLKEIIGKGYLMKEFIISCEKSIQRNIVCERFRYFSKRKDKRSWQNHLRTTEHFFVMDPLRKLKHLIINIIRKMLNLWSESFANVLNILWINLNFWSLIQKGNDRISHFVNRSFQESFVDDWIVHTVNRSLVKYSRTIKSHTLWITFIYEQINHSFEESVIDNGIVRWWIIRERSNRSFWESFVDTWIDYLMDPS